MPHQLIELAAIDVPFVALCAETSDPFLIIPFLASLRKYAMPWSSQISVLSKGEQLGASSNDT